MDALNDDQRYALSQLRELTNGGDDDAAINILESVGWDVQQAANLIFGGATGEASAAGSSTPSSSRPKSRLESLELDDSRQGLLDSDDVTRGYQRQRAAPSTLFIIARPILSLLAVPIHILSSVIRFIFGLLRLPVPQFHLRFTGLNFYRPIRGPRARGLGHGSGPERWIQELEEETGAVCIGRVKNSKPNGGGVGGGVTAASSAMDAGPSNLTARSAAVAGSPIDGLLEDGRKVLPDFSLGTYEEMLRACKREAKIGCVILVSEEHDDVVEFKRSTLTDPTFVKMLYENNIVVWGGDVRDREAWTAAEKLQATTYPFVAFLALQPRRSPPGSSNSSSNSSPTLTILSRHQGRSVPSSGPTSASTLVAQLERNVLPRVMPFLDVLKAADRERQLERQLREEQDRAYREAARKDKERIEAMMRKEREEAEQKRRQEEEREREQERKEALEREIRKKEEERMIWRRWMRRHMVGRTPTGEGEGPLRMAIRLPNGTRLVRRFKADMSLTALYAFVDVQFIPAHLVEDDDPKSIPSASLDRSPESCIETKITSLDNGVNDWWGFHIVNAYPRKEIEWAPGVKLSDVDCLKGGGQVVVELLGINNGRHTQRGQTGIADDDDDGYDTEE
ncbi:hypothetical protein AMATHDRAFT_5669 [Amanita thiersii Skay4041]|uniref:UBX domain-containing protein n=1 Tax=Amanita thiersii Skay4041 TaxID=703135 RepID=A0A2A9NGZ2_9AGAR|nr:hypothetical protein AMATHDRAFT_5669 [Amanita thiersii Skay4041]